MADFLFEIGLEEVPARMVAGAEGDLRRRVVDVLTRERLVSGELHAESFSTPRRLAVLVRGVRERQEDVAEEMLGPAVKIAYPKGREAEPGPAAVAFARKAGVDVSALKIVDTAKGEYVAATSTKPGRGAAEVLAELLPRELAAIYWAKTMYWRAGKPERFVRPVSWMVALLGEAVVPVEFGGRTAGRETFGHRVLFGAEPIAIAAPEAYAEALRGASVEPEVERRRHTIRKALDRVCRAVEGARWREDHALVDKMTHLTEWPSVILGGFEPEFLLLPEEVLVTVMRDHQNYFAVESAEKKLAPHFLAVLNTVTHEAGEAVIRHGNERVLRARFNDARFFWEFDQRVPLADRVALLEKVTFQKDLGSYAAKTDRVVGLAKELAERQRRWGKVDADALATAARLAKTDLTTELVKEFTELQGNLGGLYAHAQGYTATTCAAIYDQYRPVGAHDGIPRTIEGQLLALADKADTIAGMFSLGLEPTGSKDPFALRRAGNGIVRILAEGNGVLGLSELSRLASQDAKTAERMLAFLTERLETYLRDTVGIAYDVVKAVLAVASDDARDALLRAEAVTEVRGSEDFLALSAAIRRMKNILAQAGAFSLAEIGDQDMGGSVPAQTALQERAKELGLREAEPTREGYVSVLRELATIRPQVDAFFNEVMVMDPDRELRLGRLRLLRALVDTLSRIADFSEIVVGG